MEESKEELVANRVWRGLERACNKACKPISRVMGRSSGAAWLLERQQYVTSDFFQSPDVDFVFIGELVLLVSDS